MLIKNVRSQVRDNSSSCETIKNADHMSTVICVYIFKMQAEAFQGCLLTAKYGN